MSVLCPVTQQECQRGCISYQACELHKLKQESPNLPPHTYFIPSERLGVLEGAMWSVLTHGHKRARRVEFNHIRQVLKGLRLIPKDATIIGLALGSLHTGDSGLFIICESPHQVHVTIPNYAEERSKP